MNTAMSRPHAARLIALSLVAAPLLAGCGRDESLATTPRIAVRGAPIDGSGDAGFVAPKPPPVQVAARDTGAGSSATAADESAAGSGTAANDTAANDTAANGTAATGTAANDTAGDGSAAGDPAANDAAAQDVDPMTDTAATVEPADADAPPAAPEPDDDGVYHIAFRHLSLEGEDIDNIIDFLLFPDEFEEGEGFTFPDHIKVLDDQPITISGYMIPGRIRNNKVRDFMLVRDLASCCFGGAPNPDEWVDVVMTGDAEAEYLRYLPITVRGTLHLIGEQDQEGYAVGVYRMEATWAGEVD